MNVESLQMFCDLAEVKNFTKAAEIHNVTQSAISQCVSALERQFRSKLIERARRGSHLTSAGKVLYDVGKRILQDYGELQSKLQETQRALASNIRVVCVQSIGLYDLPPCVKRLQQNFPDVNVHIEYRRTSQVYEDITRSEVDLGLVAFPERTTSHRTVVFRHEPLVLACHPRHPLAKLKVVKLKALRGAKIIGFVRGSPTRKAVDRLLQVRRVRIECVMECDNLETMKRAVAIDSGVAILPAGTVQREVANRILAAVRLEGDYSRPLAVIYRNGKVLTPAMKRFIELLREPL